MRKLTEKFLLHRIRTRKDTEAYAQIYDVYAVRISRFISLKVRTQSDTEELQAEVFMKAWGYLCSNQVGNLNAYLYTVARGVIADFYRTRARHAQTVELDAAHSVDDGTDIVKETTLRSDLVEVKLALEELSEEYREVIVMRFFDQLETAEIAKVLGKTSNNVRVTLHRATHALKRAINKKNEGNSDDGQ